MATWKSENSMLTQLGVEILNKVKNGVGNIIVTKVVAGSGRVHASQLFQQTALSGTTKPMVISGKDVRDTGSEISIYINNDDFTESFSLNQIGVFVSHPDYQGEQLYHISQCESEGCDVIPSFEDTPVTFGYSLFLEHGNSDSIEVIVDYQGMVNIETFTEFKENIEGELQSQEELFNNFRSGVQKGKLVTVDSNNNLIASGKATSSGSSIIVTDAITHRALSLSVEGKSTQVGTPTPSAPIYPIDSKITYVRTTNGSNPKLISFPSVVELKSLGDYKDTIEWDGAKWWKVQRIQEVVLDGTTNGVYYDGNSSKTYCRYAITSGTLYKQIKDHITTAPIITSHGNTVSETSELYAFHYSSNGGIVGHFLNTVTGVDPNVQTTMQTKCAKINEWLKAQKDAGTPVKVRYVLKTPVVTEISLTEVLEMYANRTEISCYSEGNTPTLRLAYALNTTDDTIMYILNSLTRKSEVLTANTFATATIV